jgi:hypothetical protein
LHNSGKSAPREREPMAHVIAVNMHNCEERERRSNPELAPRFDLWIASLALAMTEHLIGCLKIESQA